MATIRKRQWRTPTGEKKVGWFVDFYDVHGSRDRRQFSTRREADAFRLEIEGQIRRGTYRPDAERVSLQEAADLFLRHCEERMQRRERMTQHTYKVYLGYVRNYICPDREWHEKKHQTARQSHRYFDKGLGSIKLAHLTVGLRHEVS